MILKSATQYIPGVDDGMACRGRGWLGTHRVHVQMLGENCADSIIIRLSLELRAPDWHHQVGVLLILESHG